MTVITVSFRNLVARQLFLTEQACLFLSDPYSRGNRKQPGTYELPYGIRSVRTEGQKILINKNLFTSGKYGKHEGTFSNGRGINMPMNVKDISMMKWSDANSFRTSHYSYAEEMMRLCDEERIVVIDETATVGLNLGFGGGADFHGQKIQTFDPGSDRQI